MTVSPNRPEDRTFGNPGPVEPLPERADRASVVTGTKGQPHFPSSAFLVCLRLADGDDDAVGEQFEVTYIDNGQLRAAKSARESYQHQG